MPTKQGVPTLADLFGMANDWSGDLEKRNQQRQAQKNEQDFTLQKMNHEKDIAQSMQRDSADFAKNLKNELDAGGKGKSYSIGLNPGGGVNIGENQRDPLMSLLGLKSKEDDKTEAAATIAGKRIEGQDIPGAVSQLRQVRKVLPDDQPLKSYGPVKNMVPNSLVPLAEKFGFMSKGAAEERQALEAAKALVRKPLYGTALNLGEQRKFEDAFGAPIGGSEENLRSALKRMESIPIEAMQNIEATTRPDAMRKIKERGGYDTKTLKEFFGLDSHPQPQTQQSNPSQDAKVQRYMELKQKYGK